MFRRIWPAILVLGVPAFSLAASTSTPSIPSATLAQREHHLSKPLIRAAQFANVPHISLRPACAEVHPPEALATPDPLFAAGTFAPGRRGKRVRVSFIIGTDGRVHSPLILESAGLAGDRHVLQTVRTWRYRPATCNGVPTETEGKIEFSGR
jgi:TonB family protein